LAKKVFIFLFLNRSWGKIFPGKGIKAVAAARYRLETFRRTEHGNRFLGFTREHLNLTPITLSISNRVQFLKVNACGGGALNNCEALCSSSSPPPPPPRYVLGPSVPPIYTSPFHSV
jgi:hypothetical protein